MPTTGLLVRAALNEYGTLTLILLGLAAIGWPTVLGLALAGRRGGGTATAWILSAVGLYVMTAAQMLEWGVLGLLGAIGITALPEPAHAVALIGRRRLVAFAAGVVLLGAPLASDWASLGEVHLPAWIGVSVGVATSIGLLLSLGAAFRFDTPANRRASVLLAYPLTAIAFSLFQAGLVTVRPQRIETILSAALPVTVLLIFVFVDRVAAPPPEKDPTDHLGLAR